MSARFGTTLVAALAITLSPVAAAQHAEHAVHAEEAVDADHADHADHADQGAHSNDPAHAGHADHSGPGKPATRSNDALPRTPIPPLTDADRAVAFPPALHGHEVHDQRIHSYWLVDRLEWQDAPGGGLGWEATAWIGRDIGRLWLRTEGEAVDDDMETAIVDVLYGRAVSPWWDVLAGVRHETGHGPSRSYAAFGVQGMAPYKIEVDATVFAGASRRGGVSLSAEYETLLTNRLSVQWQAEADVRFRDDPAIGVGSGLSTMAAGARLRYEVTRRFAPYVGVERERAFGRTADLRRGDGEGVDDTRVVAGVRFWF